jgi:hypothetical protein
MEGTKPSDALLVMLVSKAKSLGVFLIHQGCALFPGSDPGPAYRTPQCGVRAWTSLSHSDDIL